MNVTPMSTISKMHGMWVSGCTLWQLTRFSMVAVMGRPTPAHRQTPLNCPKAWSGFIILLSSQKLIFEQRRTRFLGEVDSGTIHYFPLLMFCFSLKLLLHSLSWTIKGSQVAQAHASQLCKGDWPGAPHPEQWWRGHLADQLEGPRSLNLDCFNTKTQIVSYLAKGYIFHANKNRMKFQQTKTFIYNLIPRS